MSNPDRLQVDVGVDDVIGNILISAYLTDEGLVVDVFQGEEPRTIWDAVREEDDGC